MPKGCGNQPETDPNSQSWNQHFPNAPDTVPRFLKNINIESLLQPWEIFTPILEMRKLRFEEVN